MKKDSSDTFYEKLFSFACGLLTGAIYGLVLTVILSYFFESAFNPALILWSAIIFAGIGIFKGNIVLEALLGFLHFCWGYANGTYKPIEGYGNLERTAPTGYFRIIMWIGFATGLVMYLAG